jgi:hypothetical protein
MRRTRWLGITQQDERGHPGDGDRDQEQRGVAAEALPHDGCPSKGSEIEPTTFVETLTVKLLSLPTVT